MNNNQQQQSYMKKQSYKNANRKKSERNEMWRKRLKTRDHSWLSKRPVRILKFFGRNGEHKYQNSSENKAN